MGKKFEINRVILSTIVVTLFAAVFGWKIGNDQLWLIAVLYGGTISIINFWLLYVFISRLLTVSLGFDYKTLAVLGTKFLILFGGLATGYFVFRLPILPLMVGFFSFFGGLIVEIIFWAISATKNS